MSVHCRGRTKNLFLGGIAVAALLLAPAAPAAPGAPQVRGQATIDFPFLAGSTPCPAGTYDFESDGAKVTLRPRDPKGKAVVLLVITRLGRHDKDATPEFVFDKVGDQLKLSEIWPSKEDGYLVLVTSEAHAHRVVGGSNPHD